MFNKELLVKMRLMNANDSVEKYIAKVIDKIIMMEKSKKNPDNDFCTNISKSINDTDIVLGTPILKNILNKNKSLSSCTVIPLDLEKDLKNIKQILIPYSQTTMGSGYDFDNIKDPCAKIKKINNAIDELIRETGNSRLSGMATLSITSEYILEFISLKRNVNFDKWHFNLSVKISDNIMNTKPNIMAYYKGKLKQFTFKSILEKISDCIEYCGEPGIIFTDRFNESNPLKDKEYEYAGFAPCAEIAMMPGEVCQFSYINLKNLVYNKIINYDKLRRNVKYITRMLDNFIDVSSQNLIIYNPIVSDKRRIGIGVCGYADMLRKLEIQYDSNEALEIIHDIFSVINYESKKESIKLAKERGAFPLFPKSNFLNRDWFMRFSRLKNTQVSYEEWNMLYKKLKIYGIRNSSTTALPPTGRSASIVNTSYSIEPYFNSKYNNVKTAYDISPENHLLIVSEINKYIDESISKTVNLKNDITKFDIYQYILLSYKLKLNGITFFRENCLNERK